MLSKYPHFMTSKYHFLLSLLAITLIGIGAGCSTQPKTEEGSKKQVETTPTIQHEIGHEGMNKGYAFRNMTRFDGIQPDEEFSLHFFIVDKNDEIVKEFDTVHEKQLHLIVVRKDLGKFMHLHPQLNKITGEFVLDMSLPSDGEYRMYADVKPKNGEQTTPFTDLRIGSITPVSPIEVTKEKTNLVNGYTVIHEISDSIKAGEKTDYELKVMLGKRPAFPEQYLGALGHSIIIKEGSLDFIHTHSLRNDKLLFETTLPSAGRYKIFTEFLDNAIVHVSPYVVEVQN